MIKKIISVSLCIMFVFAGAGSSFAAQPTQEENAVYKKSPEQRRNSTHQQKVQDLITMGATKEDAEYYASLDDKIAELERTNKKIDLSSATPLSAQEIASNPKLFKHKLLSLDPAALKAGLLSPSLKNGYDDTAKLNKDNPGKSKYVVQYPDGSSVSMSLTSEKLVDDLEVTPNEYAESTFARTSNCNGGGPGSCTGQVNWTFTSPVGWAKSSVFNFNYTVGYTTYPTTKWTMTVGNFDVGAASYGPILYSTPNKNSIPSATYTPSVDNYETKYAQGQGYFNATLSGSIGGSANFVFGSLSTSINYGASWTQYINYRIWAQESAGVAAYYK